MKNRERTPLRTALLYAVPAGIIAAALAYLVISLLGTQTAPVAFSLRDSVRTMSAVSTDSGKPAAEGERTAETDSEKLPLEEDAPVAEGEETVDVEKVREGETININTAGKRELMRLPGIGETYAERIIQKREEMGGFRSVEDIKNVDGIGEKRLEQMRPYLTLE